MTRLFCSCGKIICADQSGASGPVDQVFHRGRRPFGAAPWRPFVQPLEMACYLAQREIRIRGVDARHQRHQTVFRQTGRGFLQQIRIGQVLGDKPSYRSAQPFRCPVETALLQHAGDVVPGMVRTHPAHRRQPLVDRRLEARAIGRLLDFCHPRQCLRSVLTNARVTRELALGLGRPDSGFGAFGDQRALELRYRAEDLQREHSLGWSCRSDPAANENARSWR